MTLPAALAPLARLCRRFPGIEGQVIWSGPEGLSVQEAEELGLDPEEIAFYAEGLMIEGFHIAWRALADGDAPTEPLLLQLACAESAAPPALPMDEGWRIAAVPDAEGHAAPSSP
jgi:hypothetical protein